MMAWPQLVQIDWDAYHGKMIENCNVKYLEYANSFQDAIGKWKNHNAAAILDIRRQLKDRLKVIKGVSESEATTQMNLMSSAWTERFLKLVAITPENVWKDVCTGKYATETLPAMDFSKFFPMISSTIPTMQESQLRP